jgi:S2P endopeptidase
VRSTFSIRSCKWERETDRTRYMSTVALSLFLFNLLPLPYTDGSQLLKSLFSLNPKSVKTVSLRSPPVSQNRPLTARPMRASKATTPTISIRFSPISPRSSSGTAYHHDEDDMDEEGYGMDTRDGSGKREKEWKRRLRRGIEGGVMAMAGGWVLGWAMLALLRSS